MGLLLREKPAHPRALCEGLGLLGFVAGPLVGVIYAWTCGVAAGQSSN